MKEMAIEFQGPMCEQPTISFDTNGSQGGDCGHDGQATLTITASQLYISINGKDITEDAQTVSIGVCGDWELEGFAIALMDLGRQLLGKDDVMNTYKKWSKS